MYLVVIRVTGMLSCYSLKGESGFRPYDYDSL